MHALVRHNTFMTFRFPALPDEVLVSDPSFFDYRGRRVDVCVVADIDPTRGVIVCFMYEIDEQSVDPGDYLDDAELEAYIPLMLKVLHGEAPSEEFKALLAKTLDRWLDNHPAAVPQ